LNSLPELGRLAIRSIKGYQFQTFLVGSSISQNLVDAEDEFRCRFKVRGKPSIKGQVTRYVGTLIAKRTHQKVEHSRPDLTLLLSLPANAVAVNPRSIWISASYKKTKRGIAQRSSQCSICNGVGCSVCGYKGETSETLQAMATSFFSELFAAEGCNFIWVGNEDDQSLVGGKGRPFFVEVIKPKKRPSSKKSRWIKPPILPKRVTLNGVILKSIQVLGSRPTDIPQLEMRCKVYLKWKSADLKLSDEQMATAAKDLEKEFSNRLVRIKLSKRFKNINRKIMFVTLTPDRGRDSDGDLACTLEIGAQGGLPIRKFVMGSDDEVYPNLSKHLSSMIMDPLRPFDVLEVERRIKSGTEYQNAQLSDADTIHLTS
jgi:tRNA pseudouridine synthase 10